MHAVPYLQIIFKNEQIWQRDGKVINFYVIIHVPDTIIKHFAINDELLHNYLLPRDCPRVTFYAGTNTINEDKNRFMGNTTAGYVIVVESNWYQQIKETTLFCYEFAPDYFILIDECAGYYASYKPALPIAVTIIDDIMAALLSRNIELRFMPSLIDIADDVKDSTLQFSLIRMRNAKR